MERGGPGLPLTGVERYEPVRDLGKGNFGVAKLMRDRVNGELVAIKFIERGERVDRNVEREICNHRMLNHPNIVGFKEVFLTPSHLGIVMEFAAGGELFERIVRAGRFGEDEARYFFQQLISGVDYCHASGVCHRDLKLENTLLDGNPAPRLKICDFGYSKSAFDSQPKSTVGTPAYIAPEVLQRKEYNGQPADVWSCGVTLYVMLVGAYPFEDPADPRNFRKTIQRIMNVTFSFPPNLAISKECQDLISRIFVANPTQRISISEIRRHPWFLKNLPAELANPDNYTRSPEPHQSLDQIRALIRAARTLGDASGPKASLPLEFNEDDYMDADIGAEHPGMGGMGMGGMVVPGMGMVPGMGLCGPGGPLGGGSAGGSSGAGGSGGDCGGGVYLLPDNGYGAHPHAHLAGGPMHPGAVGVGVGAGVGQLVMGHGAASAAHLAALQQQGLGVGMAVHVGPGGHRASSSQVGVGAGPGGGHPMADYGMGVGVMPMGGAYLPMPHSPPGPSSGGYAPQPQHHHMGAVSPAAYGIPAGVTRVAYGRSSPQQQAQQQMQQQAQAQLQQQQQQQAQAQQQQQQAQHHYQGGTR